MLFLNPSRLSLLNTEYSNIESVAISRLPHKEIDEWGSEGPFAVFSDVPECKVEVTIVQRLDSGVDQSLAGPAPGQQGTLELVASPNASNASRTRLSASVVVRSVRYDLNSKPKRTIALAALSPDGSTDPITLTSL